MFLLVCFCYTNVCLGGDYLCGVLYDIVCVGVWGVVAHVCVCLLYKCVCVCLICELLCDVVWFVYGLSLSCVFVRVCVCVIIQRCLCRWVMMYCVLLCVYVAVRWCWAVCVFV